MTSAPSTVVPAQRADAWWPSKYGPDDQAGALNEITPEHRVRAAALVRTGRASMTSPMCSTSTCPPSPAARFAST